MEPLFIYLVLGAAWIILRTIDFAPQIGARTARWRREGCGFGHVCLVIVLAFVVLVLTWPLSVYGWARFTVFGRGGK